jgi:asparagine synthase (glutamine-hydrolysing)
MCGINGFIGNSKEALQKMNAALSHRGPDFAGTYIDEAVSLGHTLLSIREAASHSQQPFVKEGSPWVLLFNGQIYNTEQLKKELPASYEHTDLDTAILFATIEKYGWDFIYHIHGMFGIALYNKQEGVIKLYRDPTGQKGVYYYLKGNDFIFSSEIKGIITHSHIDRSGSEEAVVTALNFGYLFGDLTLFKYIKKLEPSSCLTYNILNNTSSYDFYKSTAPNYYQEKGMGAFEQLLDEHLLSKQEVAINLSGGLDSSLLFDLMQRRGHTVHSYTTRFDIEKDNFNEDAELAKRLAKDYNGSHHEILVTKDTYYSAFVESYKTIEEPNYNISLPTYLITAQTEGVRGDHKRVILSGDGGDELFCGYPYYRDAQKMKQQMSLLTPPLYSLLKNYRNNTHYDFKEVADRFAFFKRFTRTPTKSTLSPLPTLHKALDPLYNLYAQKKDSGMYDMMLGDRFLWLPGENFIRSDKLYMHESIELRSPLSYHPFRLFIDSVLKENEYRNDTENKVYLRKLFTGRLPSYITERKKKTGWRAPIEYWYDARFKSLFLDIINTQRGGGLIDWPLIKKEIEKSATWPGKYSHLYCSLAILSTHFNLDL